MFQPFCCRALCIVHGFKNEMGMNLLVCFCYWFFDHWPPAICLGDLVLWVSWLRFCTADILYGIVQSKWVSCQGIDALTLPVFAIRRPCLGGETKSAATVGQWMIVIDHDVWTGLPSQTHSQELLSQTHSHRLTNTDLLSQTHSHRLTHSDLLTQTHSHRLTLTDSLTQTYWRRLTFTEGASRL